MDSFARTIKLSNEFRKWALKINDIRKKLLDYPPDFSGLNSIPPFHGLIGTEEAVKLYKNVYQELNGLLVRQEEDPDNNKNSLKRILWMHLKPYYKNEIFEIIDSENCKVVFEEINNVYWPRLDPEKPFESLSFKILSL